MIKEIKYLLFIIIILVFIFFTGKYYFSDANKKKSYRSLINIDKKINLFSQSLPIWLQALEFICGFKYESRMKV